MCVCVCRSLLASRGIQNTWGLPRYMVSFTLLYHIGIQDTKSLRHKSANKNYRFQSHSCGAQLNTTCQSSFLRPFLTECPLSLQNAWLAVLEANIFLSRGFLLVLERDGGNARVGFLNSSELITEPGLLQLFCAALEFYENLFWPSSSFISALVGVGDLL